MGKRAIYLDEREQDLVRRVCLYTISNCKQRSGHCLHGIEQYAISWFQDEIKVLVAKFREPDPTEIQNHIEGS